MSGRSPLKKSIRVEPPATIPAALPAVGGASQPASTAESAPAPQSPAAPPNLEIVAAAKSQPAIKPAYPPPAAAPRHQNTPRHFECTRLNTGSHVVAQIDRGAAERPSEPILARA